MGSCFLALRGLRESSARGDCDEREAEVSPLLEAVAG
jgi:hypothetical protein